MRKVYEGHKIPCARNIIWTGDHYLPAQPYDEVVLFTRPPKGSFFHSFTEFYVLYQWNQDGLKEGVWL
jgi:hypothetical protein